MRAGSPDEGPPQLAAIAQSDVRRDLFAIASDSFRGREAGSIDELRAAVWVAERAREAGLEPAGDDGTYFQFWPMRRIRPAATSIVALDGEPLLLGRDVVPLTPVNSAVDGPILWIGEGREADLGTTDIKGRIVAALLSAPTPLPASWVSLRAVRYTWSSIAQRSQFLLDRGAAAVVLVSDSAADATWDFVGTGLMRGRFNLDSSGTDRVAEQAPVLWVRASQLGRLRTGTHSLRATLRAESFVYPSENVVARVRGTDPALAGQYVLFSGHHDHDGARYAIDGDSIWNGADDNASVTVGMLAIGRAWSKQPARRSALFVWHGAEERGLIGSRYFVWHPTVARDSIVAVLNADMIGRNSPDSAALLGSQPPHRNSRALADAALAANTRITHFVIDSSWDRPTHAEGWYFRSDHLSYARAGVPSLMFTTLLHPDYHTPRDEASRIDIAKLTRMAQWMYATGWTVGMANQRPAVDSGFKLER